MVYYPTLPKKCFYATLQKKQTQKLHLFTQCHMIMVTVSKMGIRLLGSSSLNMG